MPARTDREAQAVAAVTEAGSGGPGRSKINSPRVLDGMARNLLEVGRRSFVSLGYHGTSVAKIAEDAGASIGLLYYHFGSKEGLYRAVWTDYQQRQWQRANQAIKLVRTAGVTDGRILFLTGTRAYLSNCWENRDIVLLVLVGDLPPGFADQSRALYRRWVEMNTTLLGISLDDRPAQVLVEMAAQAIGAAARLVAGCPSQEAAEDVVDAAIGVLERMLDAPLGGFVAG